MYGMNKQQSRFEEMGFKYWILTSCYHFFFMCVDIKLTDTHSEILLKAWFSHPSWIFYENYKDIFKVFDAFMIYSRLCKKKPLFLVCYTESITLTTDI